MMYRAYQLRVKTMDEDMARVVMQAAMRLAPPEQILTGLDPDYVSRHFPDIPVIKDSRSSMSLQCWLGYSQLPHLKDDDAYEDWSLPSPRPRRSRANKKPATVD